ncbi:MAG: hypothetical protein JWL82_400 [Parcubacteria group bacterium]|nr:hypothetical protein [Parcubacteria group bacterium]
MKTLSVTDCISFGWRTFKARPWFFIGVSLIVVAISFVSGLLQGFAASALGKTPGGIVSFLISLLADNLIAIGILSIYLKAHDAVMSAEFKDFMRFKLYWVFLAASILVSFLTIVGLVLLIIPGIIVMTMLCFTATLIVDRNLGPIEAIKESARLTKGNRWKIFLLLIVVVLLNIVGAIALIVGVLIAMPISMLALVHAYRTLSTPEAPVLVA